MHKLITSLKLNELGGLELLIAIYPILSAYSYGRFHLAIFLLIFIDIWLVLKNGIKKLHCIPLVLFSTYYIIHQFVKIAFLGVTQSFFVNSTIGSVVFILSLFIIVPNINFSKLEGAINLISIFCIIGLLYHVFLMMGGNEITPIKVPFMPTPKEEDSRVLEVFDRPVSFFMEPQSYVSYMLFPLFYALRRSNFIWFAIIALSIVLSTSTTGLAMLLVMIVTFLVTGKTKRSLKVLIVVSSFALGVFFLNSPLASKGLDKATNTDIETTSRTINGPMLALTMDAYTLPFGVPYANATDYCAKGGIDTSMIIPDFEGNVFISAFWNVLVFYGVIGLILFLSIYYSIYKKDKTIIPILGCVFVALFTNPDLLGAIWASHLIYLLAYNNRKKENHESININNTVCK